ncbi:MAG: enoyl-CoA hydratase-related protein [Myxococcota bacterium]|nr:enoyl-CoA hydratase-related protein [Myxococcota bacterium]
MDYEQIRYETRDEVAWITLDRPERLNAWTPRMSEEQADAIRRADADPAVGAIVMTGEGRGFCAGADMEATFQTRLEGRDPGRDTAGGSGGLPAGVDWVDLVRRAKPLVAAVNGAAVGVGLTTILPFDLILASERARFGMLFVKVGLVPELASTRFLAQRVGFGRASDLCLSGRLVDADEAARIGLADRLVAHDRLHEEAQAAAAAFAANPDPQLRMIKRLLTENAAETDLRQVQRRESELLRRCWETPEHREAVAAFREKRAPRFERRPSEDA